MTRTPDENQKKAYKVWLDHGEGSTVVFAKSRNEAKMMAMGCDCCEGAQYIDISAKRMKALDRLYKGEPEIDWYDPETRLILVRDYGWCCLDPSWECDKCVAKKHCMHNGAIYMFRMIVDDFSMRHEVQTAEVPDGMGRVILSIPVNYCMDVSLNAHCVPMDTGAIMTVIKKEE